jgi:hypothetical protein
MSYEENNNIIYVKSSINNLGERKITNEKSSHRF